MKSFQYKSPESMLVAENRFKCPTLLKKYPRATSVHKLRPADIEVVGAMGDSLTAANGALATNLTEVRNEYRGVSWSIGGQNTDIKQLVTLPSWCFIHC